jgi:hypothetical protein
VVAFHFVFKFATFPNGAPSNCALAVFDAFWPNIGQSWKNEKLCAMSGVRARVPNATKRPKAPVRRDLGAILFPDLVEALFI